MKAVGRVIYVKVIFAGHAHLYLRKTTKTTRRFTIKMDASILSALIAFNATVLEMIANKILMAVKCYWSQK